MRRLLIIVCVGKIALVVGVLIGCLVVVIIVLAIIALLYRRCYYSSILFKQEQRVGDGPGNGETRISCLFARCRCDGGT